MPTLDVTITISDEDLAALQAWFPVWNAALTTPYASLADAVRGHSQAQVDAWVTHARPTFRSIWENATLEERDAIRAAVLAATGKTIG